MIPQPTPDDYAMADEIYRAVYENYLKGDDGESECDIIARIIAAHHAPDLTISQGQMTTDSAQPRVVNAMIPQPTPAEAEAAEKFGDEHALSEHVISRLSELLAARRAPADPAQALAESLSSLIEKFDADARRQRMEAERLADGWAATHANGQAAALEYVVNTIRATLERQVAFPAQAHAAELEFFLARMVETILANNPNLSREYDWGKIVRNAETLLATLDAERKHALSKVEGVLWCEHCQNMQSVHQAERDEVCLYVCDVCDKVIS